MGEEEVTEYEYNGEFVEITSEINEKFYSEVEFSESALGALNHELQGKVNGIMDKYSGQELSKEEAEYYFDEDEEIIEGWAEKYPSRLFYNHLDSEIRNNDVDISPYAETYINKRLNSAAAELLYSASVSAKFEGREEIDLEFLERICEEVIEKPFFIC